MSCTDTHHVPCRILTWGVSMNKFLNNILKRICSCVGPCLQSVWREEQKEGCASPKEAKRKEDRTRKSCSALSSSALHPRGTVLCVFKREPFFKIRILASCSLHPLPLSASCSRSLPSSHIQHFTTLTSLISRPTTSPKHLPVPVVLPA